MDVLENYKIKQKGKVQSDGRDMINNTETIN